MSTLEKLKNSIVPSVFAGATSVGIYYLLFFFFLVTEVPFGPISLPVWGAVAGACTLGNMAGEVLTEFVLPMIPKNESLQKYEDMVIPPAISGLATYLTMRFLVSNNTKPLESVILGSGGSVLGSYVYGML